MAEMSHPSMSALPPNVLQNSLLHCERATIESWWTATNQRCALSSDVEWMFRQQSLKIVLQHIPPKSGHWGAQINIRYGPIADIAETSLQLFCRGILSMRIRAGAVGAIRDRRH
jgi:hypothetical protein